MSASLNMCIEVADSASDQDDLEAGEKMDLVALFDEQIAMELLIGSTYRKFAARFSSSPEASNQWSQMADEEEHHAGALYWCKSLMVDVGGGCRAFEGSDEEGREAERQTIKGILHCAERPDLSLDQAVFLTARLEALGTEKFLGTLLNLPENDLFREVMRGMVGNQKDHMKHVQLLVGLLRPARAVSQEA